MAGLVSVAIPLYFFTPQVQHRVRIPAKFLEAEDSYEVHYLVPECHVDIVKIQSRRRHVRDQLSHFSTTHFVPLDRISMDIQFITYKKNGVLLYFDNGRGKSKNYVLLLIRNKFLDLRIHGLNESFVLHPPRQLQLGHLHHVSFRIFPHFAAIYLDKKWVSIKSFSETYLMTDFPQSFQVGRVPVWVYRSIQELSHALFSGCIFKLKFGRNELNLKYLAAKSQVKAMDLEEKYTMERIIPKKKNMHSKKICFPYQNDGQNSKLARAFFNDQEFTRTDVPERMELRISFRTTHSSGLLFTWKLREIHQDRLLIEVKGGKVEVSLVCDDRRNITSRHEIYVNDGKLHKLKLYRFQRKLEVVLDNASHTLVLPKACSSMLERGQIRVLGKSEYYFPKNSERTFDGCVEEFFLTNHSKDVKRIRTSNFMCHPS